MNGKVALVVGLIGAVILYEMMNKQPVAVGQSAAQRNLAASRTGATTVAGVLAGINNMIAGALRGVAPATKKPSPATPQSQSPSSKGGGSPMPSGGSAGQNGPNSNQGIVDPNAAVDYNSLQPYGTDANGNTVWIDANGNVVDQSGNLMTDLSGVNLFVTGDQLGIGLPNTIDQGSISQTGGDAPPAPISQIGGLNSDTASLAGLMDPNAGANVQGPPDTTNADGTTGNQDVALGTDANESFVDPGMGDVSGGAFDSGGGGDTGY